MSDRNRNIGTNTDSRNADGTFAAGNPGRPKGARHKATLAAQELLDGEAEALSRKAIDLALEGDTVALRLCLERIAPPRRDAPVRFSLPEIATAADVSEALARIVHAVSMGNLTPSEATAVAGLVEAARKAIETNELERRLEALEKALGSEGGKQ